jgi:hypothetical protein
MLLPPAAPHYLQAAAEEGDRQIAVARRQALHIVFELTIRRELSIATVDGGSCLKRGRARRYVRSRSASNHEEWRRQCLGLSEL